MRSATAHPLYEPANQGHVTRLTDLTGEPQAGMDHHRQGHPHNAALCLHADLVGLHLSQVRGLLDQILLDGLTLLAGRAHQSATVRSSKPKAATIACTGQPYASNVTTVRPTSAEVRNR